MGTTDYRVDGVDKAKGKWIWLGHKVGGVIGLWGRKGLKVIRPTMSMVSKMLIGLERAKVSWSQGRKSRDIDGPTRSVGLSSQIEPRSRQGT